MDKTRLHFHLSVLLLFWSLLIFTSIAYVLYYVDPQGIKIAKLYKSQIFVITDLWYNSLRYTKPVIVFIPTWLFAFKRKSLLESLGKAGNAIVRVGVTDNVMPLEIPLFLIFFNAAYTWYLFHSMYYLHELGQIAFESWENVAMFINLIVGHLYVALSILELVSYLGFMATRFDQISRKLDEIGVERIPFLH